MRKIRWYIAILFLCSIIMLQQFGTDEIKSSLNKWMYQHNDVVWMRSTVKSLFGSEEETIPVYTEKLMEIEKIEPYEDGFLVQTTSRTLKAKEPGIILYTGRTPQFSGLITVYYDVSEVFVTYGYLQSIEQLPYVTVDRQLPLAKLNKRQEFYIQIEKDGAILDLEETMHWLEFK